MISYKFTCLENLQVEKWYVVTILQCHMLHQLVWWQPAMCTLQFHSDVMSICYMQLLLILIVISQYTYSSQLVVIVTTGASCLGESLKVNNSLQELEMEGNDIGDDGISSVADGLQHNNTLKKLAVPLCKFSVKGSCSYCSV